MFKGSSQRENELAKKINELLLRMTKQRSRMDWLHEGGNTYFSQARAATRKSRNKTVVLENAQGVV